MKSNFELRWYTIHSWSVQLHSVTPSFLIYIFCFLFFFLQLHPSLEGVRDQSHEPKQWMPTELCPAPHTIYQHPWLLITCISPDKKHVSDQRPAVHCLRCTKQQRDKYNLQLPCDSSLILSAKKGKQLLFHPTEIDFLQHHQWTK